MSALKISQSSNPNNNLMKLKIEKIVHLPFVLAESFGEVSELLGEAVDLPRAVLLFLDMIFLFKSSLSKLFNGDTLIIVLRLLEADCAAPEGETH